MDYPIKNTQKSEISVNQKSFDARAVIDFASLKNIRENFTKMSVKYIESFTALVSDPIRRKVRENTAKQYLKGAQSYFRFNPCGEIDRQSALSWVASLADQKLELTTQTALVGGCRRFFDWAITELKDTLDKLSKDYAVQSLARLVRIDNPFINIKLDKVEKLHRRFELGANGARQFEQYLKSISNTESGKTTRLMCLLELWGGCRSVELSRLTVDDVRRGVFQSIPHIYLYRKGHTDKTPHAVRKELAKLLREYIGNRAGNEPLFMSRSNRSKGKAWSVKSIEKCIRQAIEAAGLKTDGITPHSLRHTNVNELLRAGVSIESVAAYEDHKSTSTTMIYAHQVFELENQAKALEKLDKHTKQAQKKSRKSQKPRKTKK